MFLLICFILMTLVMETQSQVCCAPGDYFSEDDAACTNCPKGYVSKFGEKYCNACNVCKKEYSAAGGSYCKTCGSSPGEYWKQDTGMGAGAVTGECISCPTGRVIPAGGMMGLRRRLQIPGGDSESDNYNQDKLGMKTRTRRLAEMVEMKSKCDDYQAKQCDICDSKPQQQQK